MNLAGRHRSPSHSSGTGARLPAAATGSSIRTAASAGIGSAVGRAPSPRSMARILIGRRIIDGSPHPGATRTSTESITARPATGRPSLRRISSDSVRNQVPACMSRNGMPALRSARRKAAPWPAPSPRSRSPAPRSHATAPTRRDRTISGTPEMPVSDADDSTTMPTSPTPSASSAGTITRDPTSVDDDPASTTTTVDPCRRITHRPSPSASRVTDNRSAGMSSPAQPCNHAAARIAASAHDQPIARARPVGAAHAPATAAMQATAIHPAIGDARANAGNARAAVDAVAASAAAPPAATVPMALPIASLACAATIAATPATVATAATGIVSTLSGAATGEIDPPCAMAMGVPTDHATVAAHAAVHNQQPTITVASCAADSGASSAEQHALALEFQRMATTGASTRSASTTP